MSLAPAASRYLKCAFSPTFLEPWNIMCSNRWAKPVRPGFSYMGPTWYQRLTATSGRRWSSDRITSRPFCSLYFSYLICGQVAGLSAVAVIARLTAQAYNTRKLHSETSQLDILRIKPPFAKQDSLHKRAPLYEQLRPTSVLRIRNSMAQSASAGAATCAGRVSRFGRSL